MCSRMQTSVVYLSPPLFSSYPRTTPVLFKYVTTSATDFFLPLKHPIKPVKTSSGFGTLRGYYDMIFEG